MKNTLLFLFVLFSYIQTGISQNLTPNANDISENRLMYDMDFMTDEEVANLADLGIELIYETHIGNIGIFKVTSFPVYIPNPNGGGTLPLYNIIEVNTGVRPPSQTQQGQQTDIDNYDFKSYLTAPDSGYPSNSGSNTTCFGYNYDLDPRRKKIKVAVFDSGINNDFPVSGYNPEVTLNQTFIGDQYSDNIAEDDNNHGTHIAHIIQEYSGSDLGNYVEYLDFKVVNQDGQGFMADLIIAADKAVYDYRAQILNISLSSAQNDKNYFLHKFFSHMEDRNALVVTSAGNNAEEMFNSTVIGIGEGSPPLNYISVGSIDCNNSMSLFTNFGPMVNMFVSGEDINSYDQDGNPFAYSGTSQATAIMTGMAAALATHQDNFDALHLRCAILESAQELNQTQYVATVDILQAQQLLADPSICLSGNSQKSGNANQTVGSQNHEVYPNPATDNFTILLEKGAHLIVLADMTGRPVLESRRIANSTKHQEIISLPSYITSGLYYLTILNLQTNEVSAQKIMIKR